MGLSCGAKVLKYCLFVFNLFFFIAGCICLGIGIYLIADEQAINKAVRQIETEGNNIGNLPYVVHDLGVIMAVGGAIILVIAFLGCCGAVKEWRPLLVLYAICLMIILAVEIAAAIYAAVNLHNKNVETAVKGVLRSSLVHYGGTGKNVSSSRATWDKVFRSYNCCGIDDGAAVDGVNEFKTSAWFVNHFEPHHRRHGNRHYPYLANDYYPEACCKTEVERREIDAHDPICTKTHIYPKGCYEVMKFALEEDKWKLAIVVGVGAFVAVIQLIGIIFALCLCRAITAEYVN